MYLQREPLALGAVPKASGFALQWNISFKQPKAYIPLRRKTIRVWVLALAWTPNATILRYLYQYVGI